MGTGRIMKRTAKPEELKKSSFNWQEHQPFVVWWMEHEHSGFAVESDTGRCYWTIRPAEAWNVERYRSEFSKTVQE